MRNKINNILRSLVAILLLSLPLAAFANEGEAKEEINVQEILLDHTGDAHDWHITTITNEQGSTHVSIPLPVIVLDNQGKWHVFMSSEFHHSADHTYEGLMIPTEGDNAGKVCEVAIGEPVKFDISITKNVTSLWIVVALMLIIFISCARWYRNR